MALSLSIVAEYLPLSDLVEVAIYLGDAVTLHPELIDSGTVVLRRRNTVLGTATITKYNGNNDGAIRVFFVHPLVKSGLVVTVSIETINDETFTKTGVEVIRREQDSSLLETNPVGDEKDELFSTSDV